MSNNTAYVGTDNLEVLTDAVNYNQHIVKLLNEYISPQMNVMDVGAGIGTFAEMMKHIAPRLICFEPDQTQADIIRTKGLTAIENIDHDDFKASQHIIYSLNVLEHINKDVEALMQWRTTLMPGGVMLLYVPAMPILFSSMDIKVGHYRRYTRKELMKKVAAAGFQVERCEYVDSLGVLATLAYKLIGSKNGDINSKSVIFYDRVAFPISKFLDNFFRYFFGKNIFLAAIYLPSSDLRP